MYAPNSALLNALAHHKINFKQVLKFIESRYDFEPTAFQNGAQKNAAGENQGSCKVFCFAHLNNFNQLDTLALFAEHYQAVKDNPDGTDHQNIRQFMHHGWAGVHFEGHALTPKANIDAINAQAAQLYENGGSEFEEIAVADTASQEPVEAQPGAAPLVNQPSDKLSENTENFAEPSAPKDADGSVDHQSGTTSPAHTEQVETTLDDGRLEAKAEQAILEAEAVKHNIIPPAPGSSGSMATETTYYTDNDSVADGTASTKSPVASNTAMDLDADTSQLPTSTAENTIEDEARRTESSTISTDVTSTTVNNSTNGSANTSASELTAANAEHVADNPAAFIDEKNTTSASSEPATSQAGTVTTAADSLATTSTNASGLASASASEIVASNASHIADNPAEFIDEKNTSTAADEPATGAEYNTHASKTHQHDTDQQIVDGHGAANPATNTTRDGELTEKVASPENQPVNKP